MPDLSHRNPSRRSHEIYAAISNLMHEYIAPDPETGYGPPESHENLHIAFTTGVLSGMELMLEYPRLAARIATEYFKGTDDDKKRLVDTAVAQLSSKLYPTSPSTDTSNRLIDLAKRYREDPEKTTVNLRPVLDNGVLKWDNVPPGTTVFPSLEDEYGGWMYLD